MRKRGKKILFNYNDTWDMSLTLSPIIANGLIKFKEVVLVGEDGTGHPFAGIPGTVIHENESNGIKALGVDIGDDDKYKEDWEEWKRRVDCMIYAFSSKEPEIPDVFEHSGGEINITNQEAYNKYRKEEELHLKKVQEGLDYFAKHFNDLWW